MGRNSTKITLEEDGQDDDAIAKELFLAPTKKKKDQQRKSKSKHDDDEEEQGEDEESKPQRKDKETKETVKKQGVTSSSKDSAGSSEKKPKVSKPPAKGKDEATDDESKKYQRLILFVGQIPFEATAEEVAQHFEDHGAGKVNVRLLTEKGSNKSRGLAFVDFETPQQLVRGLRVHKSRLKGRSINVERTVGGGGNNDARKEKLKQLREFQGSRVKKDVDELVKDAIQRSNGLLTTTDADELVIRSLCTLPRDAAKQVLDEILESDIAHARNKKAWILGCIKRYVGRLKTGEQFLTLEEEKAGIIEKRKDQPRQMSRQASRGASGPPSRSAPPPREINKRPYPSPSERRDRPPREFREDRRDPANKFKRGRIGASSDE